MKMITAQQAADKWGTSLRNVQDLCKRGRIVGAERWGAAWMIPEDAPKPVDGRSRQAKTNVYNQPLLRKSPFLHMTDLYSTPGGAEQAIAALEPYPEAQLLLESELNYCRGNIDKVYRYTQSVLRNHSGLYAVLAGGMLLGKCAVWNGDTALYQQAKKYLLEAPWKTEQEQETVILAVASLELSIRNSKEFPDWFMRGRFETLHPDSFPAAFVYFSKYLMSCAQDSALSGVKAGTSGSLSMRNMIYVIEPLISQVSSQNIPVAEIYLRVICAIAYCQAGLSKQAAYHLDRAIALALPDQLYAPFVIYRRQLGTLLDERLQSASPEAAMTVKELHRQYNAGWTKLHNEILQKTVQYNLSSREREAARLAALGMNNREIAQRLNISTQAADTIITQAKAKTGAQSGADLGLYI